MVWLYDPPNAQPIGGVQTSGVSIASATWNVWYGTNGGRPCVSYVAPSPMTSFTFDLNLFIRDAVTRGYVQNAWYLTNVFAGFEIWSGGVGLAVTDFYVNVT